MFTGIIRAVGVVRSIDARAPRRLHVEVPFVDEVSTGDSIAVDGCCLTVTGVSGGTVHFDVGAETAQRTTLGAVRVGDQVNLERALRLGDGLDGHLVTGHVDEVGRVVGVRQDAGTRRIEVEVSSSLLRFVATRGSVAVAGVSLTVVAVSRKSFEVAVIPHTAKVTTLGAWTAGVRVNVEVDVIARYVERLLGTPHAGGERQGRLTLQTLKDKGFS